MSKIYAPYNFVPLSKWVYFPTWVNQVSQDVPFSDGLSGTVEYTVIAATPILIGGEHEPKEPVKFFELPDGTPSIPGTSIKGMVRNVLEIASFGKLCRVDDKRYGVRDLTKYAREFYGNKMTDENLAKQGIYLANPRAGWLLFDKNNNWSIRPCEYSRVDLDDLLKMYPAGRWILEAHSKWQQYLDYRVKKKAWETAGKPNGGKPASVKMDRIGISQKYGEDCKLSVEFTPDDVKDHPHSPGRLRYSKAIFPANGINNKNGTLVFTGHPGPNKHMEFVFYEKADSSPINLDERLVRGFLDVYQETGEWEYLSKTYLKTHQRIPIFYLQENGKITAFGLSQMFKLAYDHTIHETIKHTNKDHLDSGRSDLAEVLFGRTGENETEPSWKGRVSFSLAKALGTPQKGDEITTILNGPKPTYYPNYIVQKTKQAGAELNGTAYATFMNVDARIRGWKRYPVRPEAKVQVLTAEQKKNMDVQVKLHPLQKDTQFTGKLRFHNLKPEELGALLWAMTLGNDGKVKLRHAIGMGKSFGFGQVEISIGNFEVQPNSLGAKIALDWESYLARFISMMEEQYKFSQTSGTPTPWKESTQIRELLAMCAPEKAVDAPGGKLEHMQLEKAEGGRKSNEFVDAKQQWKAVLRSYTGESTQEPEFKPTEHAAQQSRAAAKPFVPTIQTTSDSWDSVRITWDKGRQEMKVIGKSDVTAPVKGKDVASKFFSDQSVFGKLVKTGELKYQKVEVEKHGNMFTLKKILAA